MEGILGRNPRRFHGDLRWRKQAIWKLTYTSCQTNVYTVYIKWLFTKMKNILYKHCICIYIHKSIFMQIYIYTFNIYFLDKQGYASNRFTPTNMMWILHFTKHDHYTPGAGAKFHQLSFHKWPTTRLKRSHHSNVPTPFLRKKKKTEAKRWMWCFLFFLQPISDDEIFVCVCLFFLLWYLRLAHILDCR